MVFLFRMEDYYHQPSSYDTDSFMSQERMERRMKKAGSRIRKQKWKTYEEEKAAHDQRK